MGLLHPPANFAFERRDPRANTGDRNQVFYG